MSNESKSQKSHQPKHPSKMSGRKVNENVKQVSLIMSYKSESESKCSPAQAAKQDKWNESEFKF